MSINPAFWATTASASVALCRQRASLFGFNLNNEEEMPRSEAADDGAATDATPLFEKPLTPSDVGKLNRLVIPKQHAEKYFPLNGCGGDSGEKGLLLGFEDEAGKPWRFRYSYWNSSQSYVLTKGWSRFVKEKRLDAGDVVLFARHTKEAGRLFIGWRRRSGGGGQDGGAYSGQPNTVLYQTHSNHAEDHIRGRNKNSKRLRLFGVNLECEEDESEPSTTKGYIGTSSHEDPYYGYYSSYNRVSYTSDMKVWEGDVHDDEDGQG